MRSMSSPRLCSGLCANFFFRLCSGFDAALAQIVVNVVDPHLRHCFEGGLKTGLGGLKH